MVKFLFITIISISRIIINTCINNFFCKFIIINYFKNSRFIFIINILKNAKHYICKRSYFQTKHRNIIFSQLFHRFFYIFSSFNSIRISFIIWIIFFSMSWNISNKNNKFSITFPSLI